MQEVLRNLVLYLFIALAGAVLRRSGVLQESDKQVIVQLLIYFTVPCAIISGFENIVLEQKYLGILLLAATYHLVQIVVVFLRIPKKGVDRSVAIIHSNALNIGNFAMPMVQSLYASPSAAFAGVFDLVCTVFSLGVNYALASYYAANVKKRLLKMVIQKLFRSGPFLT